MEHADRDRDRMLPHIDEGTVHAWLDGALSPEEAAATAAHVAECAVCASLVAEARGLIAASSRIVSALDDVPGGVLPSATRSAPRAAARRQHDDVRLVPPARPARRMPSWVRGLAAAASLVVVTGTVLRLSGGTEGVARVAGTYEQAVSDSAVSGPAVAGTESNASDASDASAAPAASAPSMAPASEGAAAPLPVRSPPPPPSPVADAAARAASIGAAARMERARATGTADSAARPELALQERKDDASVSAKAVAAPAPPAAPVVPPAASPTVVAQRAAGAGASGAVAGAPAANSARSPVQGEVASTTAAESRSLADATARRAQGLALSPGTIERRAGCYTITPGNGDGSTTASAPPSTVRLTDSVLTASPSSWLRARLAGGGNGALAWSPIDSSRAMLRVSARGDTNTFIIAFAPAGSAREGRTAPVTGWVATRVDCR